VDSEDVPRVLGGPGRFLGDVARILRGSCGPQTKSTRAPRGSEGAFWGPGGKGETDNRTEGYGYVDMRISVQMDIQD
jgi:hypothetical protein